MTLSVQLTASSIFEELLTLMQLRPDYVPHVEINQKSAPRRVIRILLGRNAIPTYQSTPENLKWLVEGEEPNHDRLEYQDQIENLGILDLLGEYDPCSGNIILYDLLIRLCAEKLGVNYQHLYDIVLCHELSHAATHRGRDQAGRIWACFGDAPSATVEHFAQLYTHLLYAKKQCHEITAAMEKLASDQPSVYNSYFADISKDISDINSELLHARQQIFPCGTHQTYQARQTEKRRNGSMKEHLDAVSSWLKHSAESKGWKYFNYSHESGFAQLWEIGTGVGEGDKSSPLLIDWNGFPSAHPLFPKIVEFITPLDWALAKAYDWVETHPPAPSLPQVIIVDRCSHRYPGSFAVEMRRAMADALPHVHIFSALGGDNEDALALVQFSSTEPTKKPRLGQIQALRHAWIGYTVQSGDHHDLSNLLGPLVLASATGATPPSSQGELVTALWQITKWFHLHADGKGSSELALSNVTKAIKEAIKEPVDFLLIDDMAELGWAECVANLLEVDNVVSLDQSSDGQAENGKRLIKATTPYAFFPNLQDMCESPDPIRIDSIMPLGGQGDTKWQALAYISLPGIASPLPQQVVFIDLRLFARSVSKEREFLSVCVRAALAMMGEETFVRRWSDERFTEKRLRELKDKIDTAKDWEAFRRDEENCYLEALSLFIRLLAQRYFTLPLILFSSTGKRKVLEYLKPYGNVISAFDKPRIAGNAIEVEEALNGFRAAIGAAESLISFRLRMLQLKQYAECIPDTDTPKTVNAPRMPHVELYLDETGGEGKFTGEGKSKFASATLALIYPSQQAAETMHATLEKTQTPTSRRLHWAWTRPGVRPRLLTKLDELTTKESKALLADAIPAFKLVFDNALVQFDQLRPAALGVILNCPDNFASWELSGMPQLDGVYNQMLRFATEAIIFELVPELLGHREFTWRAFYPTRHRSKSFVKGQDVKFDTNDLEEAKKFWGVAEEVTAPGNLRTCGESTFRLLVEGIVKERHRLNKSAMRRSWCGAVGVRINTFSVAWPRHVHGLADWFAYLSGSKKEKELSPLLPVIIRQDLNQSAEWTLLATRLFQQEKHGEALAIVMKTPVFMSTFDDQNQLTAILLKRLLRQVMPKLMGEDVSEAMRKLGKTAISGAKTDVQTRGGTAPFVTQQEISKPISDNQPIPAQPPSLPSPLGLEMVDGTVSKDDVIEVANTWPQVEVSEDYAVAQVSRYDYRGFYFRLANGIECGYCLAVGDRRPALGSYVFIAWYEDESALNEGCRVATFEGMLPAGGAADIVVGDHPKMVEHGETQTPEASTIEEQAVEAFLDDGSHNDPGKLVVLPGFAWGKAREEIEGEIIGVLDSCGLKAELLEMEIYPNSKATHRNCKIRCREGLYNWLQGTKKQTQELQLPWKEPVFPGN